MKNTLRNLLALTMLAGLTLLFTGCATTGTGVAGSPAAAPAGAKVAPPAKAEPGWKYVCNCADCNCGTSADKPGKCTCGKPMAYKKILKTDSGYWWFCACPDCSCNALNPSNPNNCACDKPLKAFPKQGDYTCGCEKCECNAQSRQPGKCPCGTDLKAR